MKILTKDERLLTVLQIGEFDKEGHSEEKGTTIIKCRTEGGRYITISVHEVACFFGCFIFPLDRDFKK